MEILAEGLNFPEGPAFDQNSDLWCVEMKAGNLIYVRDGKVTRILSGGKLNGMCFDAQGAAWVCDSGMNQIRVFAVKDQVWKTAVGDYEGNPLEEPNDLAFDAAGNLIFTCPGNSRQEPIGRIYCLTTAGELLLVADGMYFPNGVAFSPDGKILYVTESYRQSLWKGEWDAKQKTWVNAVRWVGTGGKPGPDGIALDSSGKIFTAVYGTGKIKVFNLHEALEQEIELPGMNPTNCAFDPSGKLGLVVTEAEKGLLLSFPEFGPGCALFKGKRDEYSSAL